MAKTLGQAMKDRAVEIRKEFNEEQERILEATTKRRIREQQAANLISSFIAQQYDLSTDSFEVKVEERNLSGGYFVRIVLPNIQHYIKVWVAFYIDNGVVTGVQKIDTYSYAGSEYLNLIDAIMAAYDVDWYDLVNSSSVSEV